MWWMAASSPPGAMMFCLTMGPESMDQDLWNREPKEIFPPLHCLCQVFYHSNKKANTLPDVMRNMRGERKLTLVLNALTLPTTCFHGFRLFVNDCFSFIFKEDLFWWLSGFYFGGMISPSYWLCCSFLSFCWLSHLNFEWELHSSCMGISSLSSIHRQRLVTGLGFWQTRHWALNSHNPRRLCSPLAWL
jgi:hypothetical protein